MRASEHPERERHTARQERFLQLLLPVRDRLVHFARAITGNRDDADDLVSDTILVALERFDSLRGAEGFLSFLFTIAVRTHKRKRWRRRFFGEYDERRAEEMPSNGSATDASAEVAMLHRALARLPERQREAVVLFEISELTLEEIQRVQGGSLSGVKSRVARGRRELARLLGTDDPVDAAPAHREHGSIDTVRDDNSFLIYSEPQSHG